MDPLRCVLAANVGCIEAQRLITVNADGSGTIMDTIRPSAQAAALIAMGQGGVCDALTADGEGVGQLALLEDPTKADPRTLAGINGLKINALPEITVEFGAR